MYSLPFEVARRPAPQPAMKARSAAVLLVLVLFLAPSLQAQADTGAQKPAEKVKRLKRSVAQIGPVDDHTCTVERRCRQVDYLLSNCRYIKKGGCL
jgi:hypothetical protein